MLKTEKKFYTAEEYFEIERTAEYKSEYYHGEIFALAGGTPNHNRITINFANALNAKFVGKSCEAFTSDLRIQIDRDQHYTYPDVSVVGGELEFAEGHNNIITNPIVIVEVLSDSTKDYDRGTKFTAYRNIKTLRDYVLIDQDYVHIEYFHKEDDGIWRLREYFNIEESLIIEAVRIKIPIKEIYNRVTELQHLHRSV